MHLAC